MGKYKEETFLSAINGSLVALGQGEGHSLQLLKDSPNVRFQSLTFIHYTTGHHETFKLDNHLMKLIGENDLGCGKMNAG